MSSAHSPRPAARRATRSVNSSPYNRPAAKKSSWSLGGMMSYLNPFSWKASVPRSADFEAARSLSRRGEELAGQMGEPPSESEREEESSADRVDSSHEAALPGPPSPNAVDPHAASALDLTTSMDAEELGIEPDKWETIRVYLNERQGQKLHTVEAAGIVALLNQGMAGGVQDEEMPEPFRFSTSSPTPEPGNTPHHNATSSGASSSDTPTSPKMLAKNPNGTYRWKGGGSARKPPRNRYQSPGFGSSPVKTPLLKITPEKPKTDTKRRRVGQEAESSTAQRVPLTSTAGARYYTNGTTQSAVGPSTTNGTASTSKSPPAQTNGVHSPSPAPRLRTPGPFKPSTPAVPSPLRQTWGQSDSSSPPQPSPPSRKPTHAADFMTQLLKEVTPPKKNDIANPYQDANSILVRPPTKKPTSRKARAASKAVSQASEKKAPDNNLPELSPQAIIEATVPKGSKRARPPPDLKATKAAAAAASGSASAPPRRSARLKSPSPPPDTGMNGQSAAARPVKQSRAMIVEEYDDEEVPSPPKKQKTNTFPVNGRPSKSANGRSQTFTIEEVEDVDMQSAPQLSYMLPSEVVEPSENGTSKTTSRSTSPTSVVAPFGNGVPSASSQRGGFGSLKSSAPRAPSKLRYSFQVDKEEKEREKETAAPPASDKSALGVSPIPSFRMPPPPKPANAKPAAPKDAKAIVLAMAVHELPRYSFPFPTSSPGAGPSSHKARKEALVVPVSSLPAFDLSIPSPAKPATPAPTTMGFNWGAAGMKPPARDTWTCGTCMVSNPSAAAQCTACEEPRAEKPKAAAPAAFNYAAAGMAPPAKPAAGTWICNECMLSNPPSATTECGACHALR